MRNLLIAVLVLSVAVSAGARSLEGSYVELLVPPEGIIVPGETNTFEFGVYNASTDAEWVTDVLITFPDQWVIDESSMSYVEVAAGRPSWDMMVPDGPTAMWLDNDGGYGELYGGEYTTISVDVMVATQLYGLPIYWCIKGDIYGEPPHEVCDCIYLQATPVEEASWASIKAMYR